ncbi:hypothetical protein [Streptomyces phaeochromogenes]
MANLHRDASRVVRDAQGECTSVQRLSTLSGLNLPVLFILMRDSREPTQANAADRPTRETLAESVPRVFAGRLRAARRAAGISQAALAEAMRVRGFNWRQTTVAKSEAGDRPVLFAEALAMTQILKREFEYFLFEGTELDNTIDEAKRTADALVKALAEVEFQFHALNNDLQLNYCIIAMGKAISKYQKSGNGEVLGREVLECFSRWASTCVFGMGDVYESVGIDPERIKELDRKALSHVAQLEQERTDRLTQEQLMDDSPERLNAVSDFLAGKEVDGAFIDSLRDGHQWASFMAGAVLAVLQECVRVGDFE